MGILFISFSYIGWLYSDGWKEYLRAWANFHWFFYHFFSIGILLRTLFVPWHRLSEAKTRGFDPGKFFERIVINIVLRLVGFVVRGAFLIAALVIEALVFVFGLALFLLFLLSPGAIPILFFMGIMLFLL